MWDSDWLTRINGGYEDNEPPRVTQADLQEALKEQGRPEEPPPVLTGKALSEVLLQTVHPFEPSTWQELPDYFKKKYTLAAQIIHERYVLPAAEVSPVIVAAQIDIMHALQELLREWYHQSLKPEYVHVWEERFGEMRRKTEELLGKNSVSK